MAPVAAQQIQFQALERTKVEQRLDQFSGDNQQREQTLKAMFADAGCDAEHLSEQPVKGSKQPNVVCVLPGKGAQRIIVGAHFDHVPGSLGIVDNWSGASLLPSLYESVKMFPREHTFVFIGFTDEEMGEVGSRFYARRLSREDIAQVDAMVNMDTLGLAPTETWASHSDKWLVNALFAVARSIQSPVSNVNVEQVGSTDSEQFRERKIPAITVHSLTQETWNAHILHTAKDQKSAMKLDQYYETYHLLSAYLAFLDISPHAPSPKQQ